VIAAAVAATVFLVSPARVDSQNIGMPCPFGSQRAFQQPPQGCDAPRTDTDLTWGWALGNKVRVDGYGEMAYRVRELDVALDAIAAGMIGGIICYALPNGVSSVARRLRGRS
jgi:hypothetical protein